MFWRLFYIFAIVMWMVYRSVKITLSVYQTGF